MCIRVSSLVLPLLLGLLTVLPMLPTGHAATPAPTSAPSHTICLAFPSSSSGRTSTTLSTLAACSRIVPILQSLGISWAQSHCAYTPPPNIGPGLLSADLQVYTCMTTSTINTFSSNITALWGAAFPFVRQDLRNQLVSTFRTLPTIGLLVSTTTARLPVGLASQRGKWVAMVADTSVIASPPPPMGSGSHFYPPPAPPVPPRQECRAFGGGDALRVQGLVLCMEPKYNDLQYDNKICRMNLTLKLTNVGANIIPERGIGTSFSLLLWTAQLMGWRQGMFNVLQAESSIGVINVGKGVPAPPPGQQQVVRLTFSILCNGSSLPAKGLPPSCGCAADVTLQPLGSGINPDPPCPAPALSSSVNGSKQCFSVPLPAEAPPPGLSSQSSVAGLAGQPTARRVSASSAPSQCTFPVQFSVTNLGASAMGSIAGPLLVDLRPAQGTLVLAEGGSARSRVTCDGAPGSQLFRISQFGSLMQPSQSSSFTLSFKYQGTCSEVAAGWADLTKLIVFLSGQPDPVTSVQSSSEVAGNHITSPDDSALSFNDQVNVDVRSTCISPQAILMDYKRGGNGVRPTSYIYVNYPAQVDGIPVIHGKVPSGFYDNTSGFSSADLFNVPKGPTSTGSLAGKRIIKVVAYVMNTTDGYPDNFVCGLDLWVVPRAQVYTGGQISNSPDFKLGCSKWIDASLPVTQLQFAGPPPNAFFGWFAGAEHVDRARITNLQVVWVACSGDDPNAPSPIGST